MKNCISDSNKGNNYHWPLTGKPSALGYKVTFGKAIIEDCTNINGMLLLHELHNNPSHHHYCIQLHSFQNNCLHLNEVLLQNHQQLRMLLIMESLFQVLIIH